MMQEQTDMSTRTWHHRRPLYLHMKSHMSIDFKKPYTIIWVENARV